jgi:hypothetical protein
MEEDEEQVLDSLYDAVKHSKGFYVHSLMFWFLI